MAFGNFGVPPKEDPVAILKAAMDSGFDPVKLAGLRGRRRDELVAQESADLTAGDPRAALGRRVLRQDLTQQMDDDPYTGQAAQDDTARVTNALSQAATTMRPEIGDASATTAKRNAFADFMSSKGKAEGATLGKAQGEWSDDAQNVADAASRRTVAEVEARPGMRLGNGRPVTSGDVGRIVDLDTALSDLDALEKQLRSGNGTGVMSKIGASVTPNFFSEFTGIGSAAKSRQATIDRVKQVIGKSLEGGVLRKEDEIKYEKILPTIGDPPEVAGSKIAGLRQAIQSKKLTTVNDLGKAGYNVGNFSEDMTDPDRGR